MSHAFNRIAASLLLSGSFTAMAALTAPVVYAESTIEELKAQLEQARSEAAQAKKENQALRAALGAKEPVPNHKSAHQAVSRGRQQAAPATAVSASTTSTDPTTFAALKAGGDSSSALAGFYIGINGGYGGGDVNGYTTLANLSFSPDPYSGINNGAGSTRYGGAVAGGQIGYNYIFASHFIVGGEFDFDWANIAARDYSRNSGTSSGGLNNYYTNKDQLALNWISTARGRIGYIIGNFAPYVTGGFAFGQMNESGTSWQAVNGAGQAFIVASAANSSKVLPGWALGAGIEMRLIERVSLKAEYLYTQLIPFPSTGVNYVTGSPGAGLVYGSTDNLGFHQVRVGFNYHPSFFDAPAPAVVAKY